MTDSIIVALISLAGTALGAFGGIIASAKLTAYRISLLEKKADRHNRFAERMPFPEEQIKVINHRIGDLERGDSNAW